MDLLIQRDESGNVSIDIGEDKQARPILRKDAGEILKHIVGYGYSAAHITNSDAFRLLHNTIENGHLALDAGNKMRISSKSDVQMLKNARLIGIAGVDRMEHATKFGSPQNITFVSEGDLSLSSIGPAFLRAHNVILVNTPNTNRRPILGDRPLEPVFGGHDEAEYVKALLHKDNWRQIEFAQRKLSSNERSL